MAMPLKSISTPSSIPAAVNNLIAPESGIASWVDDFYRGIGHHVALKLIISPQQPQK